MSDSLNVRERPSEMSTPTSALSESRFCPGVGGGGGGGGRGGVRLGGLGGRGVSRGDDWAGWVVEGLDG